MDFNNTIRLSYVRDKYLLPIDSIVNVIESIEKSYSSNEEKYVVHIVLRYLDFIKYGLDLIYTDKYGINMKGDFITIKVDEEYKELMAILKGNKGKKVLYE